MKVLFINAVCGTGSTGRIISDLVQALKRDGDSARVLYGIARAEGVETEDAVKINHRAGYYCHNLLARLTDHTGLFSGVQTRFAIKKIREYDPDIIHIHNLHGYYIQYEILFRYLARSGKPIVWTLHDCWGFTGHCVHFAKASCIQWKTGCVHCPLLREYPVCYTRGDVGNNYRRKKAAFTAPKNMTIVTPSRWLAHLAGESFLGCYPVQVIPNGVDTAVFSPSPSNIRQRLGLTREKIILGVANVWTERKGYQDFLKMRRCLPDHWRIVLVGLTPAQAAALPDGIIGITRTNNPKELAELYTSADVFVNPTYEDTYPTVNLEAQACGTPVITYDPGGCPETIRPGMGWTVPVGNFPLLWERICQVLNGTAGVKEESSACRSQNTCVRDYLGLYRNILNQRNE